jgi:hypothetical protein
MVLKQSKIKPITQPNQQIKNHLKMAAKITKKVNFRFLGMGTRGTQFNL